MINHENKTREQLLEEVKALELKLSKTEGLNKKPKVTNKQFEESGPQLRAADQQDKNLVDGKYSFRDLVDIDRLRLMFERFSKATGFTTGLVSHPDQDLLIATGWRDICTKFHRNFPVSEVHCKQSNLALTSQLIERKAMNIHKCESGLIDGATPIIIKGVHIANLFTGQILFEKPDFNWFRKQGEAYGYNIDPYLEALRKVPVVTEKKFMESLGFLREMAMILAGNGLTELKNREAAQIVYKSEAKFRGLVETCSDFIWEVNIVSRYTYVSPQVELMLGYMPDEVIGKTPYDFMPPDEAVRIAHIFKDKAENGEPIVVLENIAIHKKGHHVVLETSGVPVFDEKGKVTGYRGVDRDITVRKKAEKEIREKTNLLDNVINRASSIAIATTDLDMRITSFNPIAQKFFGYFSEEVLGKTVFEIHLMEKVEPERLKKAIKSVRETGQYKYIITQELSSGKRILSSKVTGMLSPAGKLTGYVLFSRDVTDFELAKETLLESEEKISTLLNATTDAAGLISPDGTIITVNNALAKRVGKEKEYLPGKKLSDLFPFEIVEDRMKMLNKAIDSKKTFQWEHESAGVHYNNSIYPVFDETGNVKMMAIYSRDITQRKQAEVAVKESERTYRTLINNLPGFVYRCLNDENWTMEYISGGCEEITGYPPADFINNNKIAFNDIIGAEYQEEIWDTWQVKLKEKATIELEYPITTKSGQIRWVWERGCGIYSDDGKLLFLEGFITDITEQKLAGEALKESETKFRGIFENKGTATGIFEENSIITDCNTMFEEMSGYSKSDIIDKMKWSDFVVKEDLERLQKYHAMRTEKEGPPPSQYECRIVNKHGKFYDTVVSISMVDSSRIVSLIDITDRKQADMALLQSEEKYRAIVENNHDAIYIYKGGKFLFVNDKTSDLSGYTKDELYNMILWDLVHPDDRKRLQGYGRKRAMGEDAPNTYSAKIVIKNGDVRDCVFSVSIIHYKNDFAVLGAIHDITERKQAEEAIQESEQRLRKLIETTSEGFWLIDDNMKTTDMNQSLCDMIGYSREEVFGKTPFDFVDEENHEIFAGQIIKSKNTKHRTYEISLKKKNGENLPAIFNASTLFDESGKKTGSFAFITDITEQKNAELDLKKALEKATESDRLKSAFLSNMSHEIRTPMNGILGFLDLLNEPGLPALKKQEFTNIIHKSSSRLLNTINDLIDISRIEAGQMKVSNTKTSINQLLNEIHAFFTPEANSKKLMLTALPTLSFEQATVFTDNNKLHGILTNLVKNAIKYTKRGRVTFGYLQKGNLIEFFIRDTGIGVPANRQQAIFNRFEQADIEDVKAFEGSGLGLAIAKAYVEMLGGKIWMTSEEGKGSKFMFTIPYNKTPEQKIEPAQKASEDVGNEKVAGNLVALIAEDEEVSTQYFETILEGTFRKIIYVKTGKEAIETCRDNPEIDIVLMDIKMPVMDGYEATREIRKFNKDVIVIAQTAYAQIGDREKSLEAGCDDYISKPIKKDMLIEKIMGLING